MEIEATLSADYPGPTVPVSVVTPAGESPPHAVMVDREPVVAEKEPNNGFAKPSPCRSARPSRASSTPARRGRFPLRRQGGQQVVLEVFAARYGSPLDSLLTLYDAEGRIVAPNDDFDGTPDSRIEATLPRPAPTTSASWTPTTLAAPPTLSSGDSGEVKKG